MHVAESAQKIPKTVHYCWFGGKPKTSLAQRCIASWKKLCPGWTFAEWNESSYDVSQAPEFAQDAYAAKKWAFVSDWARLDVVSKHGGVYFDVDVELVKPIDDLLSYGAFFALERKTCKRYGEHLVNTGLGFGAVAGHEVLEKLKDVYMRSHLCLKKTCVQREWPVWKELGLRPDGTTQHLPGGVAVFEPDVFCPIGWADQEASLTPKTRSVHWFALSWTKS